LVDLKKMAKNQKNEKQRAVSVYLTKPLEEWLKETAKKEGHSQSSILRDAITQYARTQGFDEKDYEIQETEENSLQQDEVSLIARQLTDLAATIERITKNGVKCFAI
jgi:predicted DNA-binding protein